MEMNAIRTFFMWCTIMNGALLLLTGMICAFAGDWVYRVQSRWYPVTRDVFNVVIYSYIGLLKILFLMFSLVPYIALVILG